MYAERASARSLQRAGNWFSDLARHQFITRNRRVAAGLTAIAIAVAVLAVQFSDRWFSPGEMILPLLAGGLLLWPRALRILIVGAVLTATAVWLLSKLPAARPTLATRARWLCADICPRVSGSHRTRR